MANSSLIKTILHKSLAEGVYRDVTTRSSNYYYFLGKTLKWDNELAPPYPVDSYAYEREVRSEIITLKQITPSDVAFVIPRKNWISGLVYDMFDDEYCNQIIGIDVISGGIGYNSLPTITISGGGGTGAVFTPVVLNGEIIGVDLVSRGDGYISEPTVTVTGDTGTGAQLRAVLNLANSGSNKLEDSDFYVITNDFNVYKCLDNNNNSRSTVKPTGTAVTPLYTSDGYVWKYMYTVPINLRTKFLDDSNMPVVSALTNQFYTNGSLENVIINNKGENYSFAKISVSGNGYSEQNPVLISGVDIISGGTGYNAPTVVFEDPIPSANPFLSSAGVFVGQYIYTSAFNFYEVLSPGVLSTSEPTFVKGIFSNGTATLKYVGTRAKATATVVSGTITSINLIGSVGEIEIINPGSGYTTAPAVNITGDGSGATAIAKLNTETGSILYVTVSNSGDDYTTNPIITFGDQWEPNTPVTFGEQYYYQDRLYTVTTTGTTGTSFPTHTTGQQSNGTSVLQYAGVVATASVVRRFGFGYRTPPTVTIQDDSGVDANIVSNIRVSSAKILPVLQNGQLIDVIIADAGVGYTSASLQVTGNGTGAALLADLSIGNIQSLQANNEILTTPGTISAIKLISGGFGYGVASISIQGDGVGAQATAVIDSASGRIVKINITDPGQNYTFADVIITGNGKAATARAILSPPGGHGKNSPDELYARTLMFYTNLSNDLNQGISVDNDYRQLGIIKNPRQYKSTNRYQSVIGSACFFLQGNNISTQQFPKDADCFINRVVDGTTFKRRYRVVNSTESSVLVQSLDNDVPLINDVFLNKDLQSFTVTLVSNPSVDKYSGQMMFIDNKAAFTPSEEETVILRTVIKF
jgi:hypothetical protein